MLRQIIAITIKDLKVLFKDVGGITTFFLMPAMFIFVMSNALAGTFSSDSGKLINVLVVNQDRGAIGATLAADLKSGGGINFETDWNGDDLTRDGAEKLIVDHERDMAIVIPSDFSASIENGSHATLELIADPATSDQVLGPVKSALIGIGQQAIAQSLMPIGIETLFAAINQSGGSVPAAVEPQLLQTASQNFSDSAANLLELKQTQPAGMHVEQFPNTVQQNVPGWTLFGVFFIAQALAISILDEKRIGSFRRLLAAPMSRATILLGKLSAHMILNLIQIVLMFAVGVFILPLTGLPQLTLGDHPEGLILVSICASLAANGLGLLLASLGKTAEQIGGLSSLLVVTLAAIGGVMVPRFVMPQFMQTLSFISPHAWALNAYQDILVRGYGVAQILPECGALLVFAAVFFGIALWRFKWD